jgi:hypothetical protein
MSLSFDPWILEEGVIPLENLTLEEGLKRGETRHDKERDLNRVSVSCYPAILQAGVHKLKVEVGGDQPLAVRLVIRHGARILQGLPEIKKLDEMKTSQMPNPFSPLEWASAFASRRYDLRGQIFLQAGNRRSVPVIWWVHGLLSELASITSLPTSQITVLAIVAGISRSRGLPEPLVKACQEEIEEFRRFLRKGFSL